MTLISKLKAELIKGCAACEAGKPIFKEPGSGPYHNVHTAGAAYSKPCQLSASQRELLGIEITTRSSTPEDSYYVYDFRAEVAAKHRQHHI